MKKNILLLLLYFSFVLVPAANAGNIAKIKDINVTEHDESIVFDVKSTKDVPYNVVNYANGNVGVKFIDSSLDSGINDNGKLQLSQSEDIDEATLNTDDAGNVEVVFSGNKNIAGKKISVNTEVANNSIILIEPEPEIYEGDFMPLSLQATNLPPVDDYEIVAPEKAIKTVQAKDPPALSAPVIDENQITVESVSTGKRLLAQASPVEDEEVIEFGSDSNADSDAETVKAGSPPVSASDNSKPESKKGFVDSAFDWIKTHIFLSIIIGIAVLVVGFILLVIVLYFIGSKMQGPDGTMPMPTAGNAGEGGISPSGMAIEDNEPVDFIPPRNDKGTQSVSDAINKVINMRNKMN